MHAPPDLTIRAAANNARDALPWWRCGPLWLVWSALGSAVLLSSAVAVVAVVTGDPEVPGVAKLSGRAKAAAATRADAPALQGRNHAATPKP